MNILGLSCFYHDSAACLVRDGQVVAAVEEERLTRKKHDNAFPKRAIQTVLKQAGINGADLDGVVFYEKPLSKLERVFQTAKLYPEDSPAYLSNQLGHYVQTALQLPALLKETCGYTGPLSYCDHHLSHAAETYYQSPFDEAAILVVDGVGEWATTSLYHGHGANITPLRSIHYPHSLGLLYATITAFLGFEVNEGEYKVMGLAPYGKPTEIESLRKLITFHEDGSFALDLAYFCFMHDEQKMFTSKIEELLGPQRKPEDPLLQHHKNIAASVQKLIEESLLHLAKTAKALTGSKNLCLSGGVAHNIVANTKIREAGLFDNVFIHFASGDSGGAIGSALHASIQRGASRQPATHRQGPYLGPDYTADEIEAALAKHDLAYERLEETALIEQVAELLADEFVVGWHQGRMEFGPRALGNRSILASACSPDMKEILNARVKHREEFRPFAPAVLAEKAADYFALRAESPAMLYAAQVVADKQASIPSITHIDGSARPQTVARDDNPIYYDLIAKFYELTGTPVIVNTSFNVRGEPIVCSPEDAINCFIGTDIDFLVMGNFLVKK